MKNAQKFVCAGLAVTAFFCIISAVCTAVCLENVRKTTNSTVNRLVVVMLEKYPDISEKEIAEILNDKTAVEDDIEILEKYGIDLKSDWISYGNQGSYKYVVISAIICLAFGIAFIVVFLLYLKMQKQQTMEIAKRIERINLGDYSLQIDENSEDNDQVSANITFSVDNNSTETVEYTFSTNGYVTGVDTVKKADGSVKHIYTISGIATTQMQRGVNIVRHADGTVTKVVKR